MTLVEGTTGAKRTASSPLDRMKVKKCKGTSVKDINLILERTTIKKEISKLQKFRFETMGHGLTPTFKVQVKNSLEKGSKWENIGSVPIRDPSVWGQIPDDTIRESILVALGLMEE